MDGLRFHIVENCIKPDDLGVPPFQETSILNHWCVCHVCTFELLNCYCSMYTSSATQGGGRSFTGRKSIGEVDCIWLLWIRDARANPLIWPLSVLGVDVPLVFFVVPATLIRCATLAEWCEITRPLVGGKHRCTTFWRLELTLDIRPCIAAHLVAWRLCQVPNQHKSVQIITHTHTHHDSLPSSTIDYWPN